MGKIKDLTNEKTGKLTVVSYYGKDKNGSLWNCKCDCGNEIVVPSRNIIRHISKSCGCEKHKRNVNIGDRFGYLTIIELPDNLRKEKVTCQCDCGNIKKSYLIIYELVQQLLVGVRKLNTLRIGKIIMVIHILNYIKNGLV